MAEETMSKVKEIKWPQKLILSCGCCNRSTRWLSVDGKCFDCTKETTKGKRVISVTAIDNFKGANDLSDEED